MKLEKLLNDSISLDDAIKLIKENKEMGYIWLPVKNETGCLFEVGGNKHGALLNLSAYIPIYDSEGKPTDYGNGFVSSNFKIDEFYLDYANKRCTLPKDFSLIDFLKETDFRSYVPNIEELKRQIIRYEYDYFIKF